LKSCGKRKLTAAKKRKNFIKTSELRESFLSFFERSDHRRVPSSPVIPYDDPTLLFTNAGMNQFKDVFTGKRKVNYKRATSSQKCIRAGGKHNDLDNVGFTARHHTFFEMLGNFSFGDYFKEEAIALAWDWATKEIKLPVERLYATVYDDDDEAFKSWEKIAPKLKKGRILRFGKKDNYWSMGESGPCGPCSEIHFDRGEKFGTGPNDIINGETERFVEIWNLVFMQFDQLPDGKLANLPKPSVDTGAGLERLAAIVQNVDSNYQIDIFKSIIKAIIDLAKSNYKDNPSSHHVIADHLRALTFAIADGAGISNEGQGYVLRRILRRAARHGRNLGMHEPFIFKLVPTLVNEMGDVYPEIKEKQKHIENVIRTEEEAFGRTLETGLEHIDKIVKKLEKSKARVIPGEEVFRLYDTYGFPYDLTEIIAAEHGFNLDKVGFDNAMQKQQEQSKAGSGRFSHDLKLVKSGALEALEKLRDSKFVRSVDPVRTVVREVFKPEAILEEFQSEYKCRLILLEKTPFYLESGGQVSDTGKIREANVELLVTDVIDVKGKRLHLAHAIKGSIDTVKAQIEVSAEIDTDRRGDIMRNHTATHLAHAALRKVLGSHVKQSGSYVGPDRLRFDFSHHQPMTPDEIKQVEQIVNEEIMKGTPVNTDLMPIEEAKKSGAMALFGEKYGDTVRVVSVDDFSKELCGGTHVQNVGQIGPFIITLETGIASGVRRLEAITGREAIKTILQNKELLHEVSAIVGRQGTEIVKAVGQLKESSAALQKELKKVKSEAFTGGALKIGQESEINGVSLITHNFGETDRDIMSGWIDKQKESSQALVALGLGNVNGKLTYMASASSLASKKFNIDIGKISKELLAGFGGQGGGKTNFAQGSVAKETNAEQFFEQARELIAKHKGAK